MTPEALHNTVLMFLLAENAHKVDENKSTKRTELKILSQEQYSKLDFLFDTLKTE